MQSKLYEGRRAIGIEDKAHNETKTALAAAEDLA